MCGFFCLCVGKSFVCGRFSASVGFMLRPRLNGVLMALKGGGSGEVRASDPGAKMGEKWRVGLQVGLQVGLHFRKTGVTKLLPTHTVRGGGNEPKNGVKCRKLPLFV